MLRELESASRAKDEFLAMLGHELRNPLAPILTALQLIRMRGIQGVEKERAVIERQVRHVVRLVDDLMDVSRVTRGKIKLEIEPLRLADVVAKGIEMASPIIEERKHRLTVAVADDLMVDGDAGRLAQVLSNVLTNAAKYTDLQGTIDLVAERRESDAWISVRDNGVGIDPVMLPRMFHAFAQERQDGGRSQSGLGLGLAIVRNLVDAHGGSVTLESEGRGRGTMCRIRLPISSGTTALAPSRCARRRGAGCPWCKPPACRRQRRRERDSRRVAASARLSRPRGARWGRSAGDGKTGCRRCGRAGSRTAGDGRI